MNTSPLILLSRVDLLDILEEPAADVIVPDRVIDEVSVRGPNDPTVRAITQAAWLNVVPTPTIPDSVLLWNLGDGESAVLAIALADPASEVVLDDLDARRFAKVHGLKLRGTLGMVLLAKQVGMISEARPVLERLRHDGMYLSDAVMNHALSMVGE